MAKVKSFFYLNDERDAVMLAHLTGLAARGIKSEFIRDAIYEKMARENNDDIDPDVGRGSVQDFLELSQLVTAIRQAVRDELRLARFSLGAASEASENEPPDNEERKEQQRKLRAIFNTWDDDDDDGDEN